ncbi:MAG TPA: hypothetical protein VFI34_04005 [Candidatus Limnocylindrales bacterium]|nr:hypothetical protein [Candidatus Limnocylindrales bacterium]
MERIYTAPVLDKLGVRPGMRVTIVGSVEDEEELENGRSFAERLSDRTSDVTIGEPAPSDTDLVFLAADSSAELEALGRLRPSLRPNGAIWVVSRKGRGSTLRDVEVMAAARAVDLIDNKVVAFSARRTSIRLVIPVALRPRV